MTVTHAVEILCKKKAPAGSEPVRRLELQNQQGYGMI